MFDEAISAIRNGERARARDLLTRLLKMESENADYWVWMSAVVETPKERLFCLKSALRVDPQNPVAKRGMLVLGALPPEEGQVIPSHYQKRDWQAILLQKEQPGKGAPPTYVFVLMAAALVVVIGLLGFAFFGEQLQFRQKRRLVIVIPTQTQVAGVAALVTETSAPVPGTPTPLWMLLEVTYTPTPLYVNTPHMDSEAFGLGVRALQRGEWAAADNYLRQAATQIAINDPHSPDVLYYIAENYRLQDNMDRALETFNQIIDQAPGFAPAYLGRARVRLAQESAGAVEAAAADIQTAIAKDSGYGEAYLALAGLQTNSGQANDALATLDQALVVLPDSPLVYLYRAQTYLDLGDHARALQNARKANELDVTLLLSYRIMAEALQGLGDFQGSIEPLTTYIQFEQDDPLAWQSLASAYLDGGNSNQALYALNRALSLDNQLPPAYLDRASVHLELGSYEESLDDFQTAARFIPDSFDASIGIGKALMGLGYPGDAWDRFERTRKLAETDRQKAELIFWRGQSLEALGERAAAIRDYRALVDLPAGQADASWISFATKRLEAWTTLTPTPRRQSPTRTPTPTHTRTIMRTPTPRR